MRILYRYLSTEFLKFFIILIFLFSLVVTSSQLLHLPGFVYSMNLIDFLNIIFLVDISFLKFQILFGFFIAWLLTGIKIRESNEIYAIYSLGIANKDLLKPVLFWTAIFSIIAMMFSSIVAPYANRERAKFLTAKVRSYILESLQPKNFSKISETVYVYIDKKENNRFENIILHNRANGFIITAKDGYFHGNYIILNNGFIDLPSKDAYSLISFKKYSFNIDVSYLKETSLYDKETSELMNIIFQNQIDSNRAKSILLERLFFPIPFIFIGFIGFFLGINLRRSKELLLAVVILIGIIYMVSNHIFVKLMERNVSFGAAYLLLLTVYFSTILMFSLKSKD